jgi:methylenetetrahydrofolate reductase (NADPH)
LNTLSHLSSLLHSGEFVVAAELSPPKSVNYEAVARDARILRGYADAVNVTDNQAGSVRTASIPVCAVLQQHGVEPVAQMTVRDRNRLAIQADLLGASMLGIRNLLCLSGDHGRWGDHPDAKGVYDIDSIHLVRMVHNMVEHGIFDNGRSISRPPQFFVGAAANPFAPPYDYRPFRLAKKVTAGAQFVQTQLIYNVERFRRYMARVVDMGLHEQVYLLAGVGPLKSVGAARYMAKNVAGMEVPDEIVARMEKTPKAAQPEEGIEICVEIIEQIREIPGVDGLHIMAVHWAEAVPEIVTRAGLYPRPPRTAPSTFPFSRDDGREHEDITKGEEKSELAV